MKMAPVVNFIHILCAAFANADPKSAKYSLAVSLFALLGSMHVKAESKTLVKKPPSLVEKDLASLIIYNIHALISLPDGDNASFATVIKHLKCLLDYFYFYFTNICIENKALR